MSFTVPITNLPELASWVAQGIDVGAPQLLNMSDHQKTAQIEIVLNESSSYRSALDLGCDSLGVVPRFDALGQLQLIGMDYYREADYGITYDDILEVSIGSDLPELSSLMLRHHYDHDNSYYRGRILVQNDGHHYPEGWLEPAVVDTVLVNREEAVADIYRRANRRFVRRRLYSIVCFIRGAIFGMGDRLHVFHPAWGLDDTGTILAVPERLPGSNKYIVAVEI